MGVEFCAVIVDGVGIIVLGFAVIVGLIDVLEGDMVEFVMGEFEVGVVEEVVGFVYVEVAVSAGVMVGVELFAVLLLVEEVLVDVVDLGVDFAGAVLVDIVVVI